MTIAKTRALKFFKVLCHKSRKRNFEISTATTPYLAPSRWALLFFTVSNQSCLSTFCPSCLAEFSLPVPWQSVQTHTNIITKFSHIHEFPLSSAMEAPPCVHRLQQSEWSDISNVRIVILFGIQSLHGCNPHGGGTWGFTVLQYWAFFMRYFSNFHFNMRYCGII